MALAGDSSSFSGSVSSALRLKNDAIGLTPAEASVFDDFDRDAIDER